jgi:hypothetical protein
MLNKLYCLLSAVKFLLFALKLIMEVGVTSRSGLVSERFRISARAPALLRCLVAFLITSRKFAG